MDKNLVRVVYICIVGFISVSVLLVEKHIIPWWLITIALSAFSLSIFHLTIILWNDLMKFKAREEAESQKDLEMEAKIQQQHLADAEEESEANRRMLESMDDCAKQMAKIFRPSKNPPETPENDS